MIVIFSYDRHDSLLRLCKQLHGKDRILVIDDGSDFNYDDITLYADFIRYAHKGKEGFWINWNYALELCRDSDSDYFMFVQDDVRDIQYDKIRRLSGDYAFNFMNVGEDRGWTSVKWQKTKIKDVECWKMSYVDCNFTTTRKVLDKIDWNVVVDMRRFSIPNISSGVGESLSKQFAFKGIDMYMPQKSLAYHGNHESKMHVQERKRNPLISV